MMGKMSELQPYLRDFIRTKAQPEWFVTPRLHGYVYAKRQWALLQAMLNTKQKVK